MLRNLAQSLFEHEQVRTTLPKAKELKRFAERLITLAKRAHGGDVAALRLLKSRLSDRAVIPQDHREDYEYMSDAARNKVLRARSGRRYRSGDPKAGLSFTAESIVHRLVTTIAARYVDRQGGYTRIIKVARARIGDSGAQAIVQLVGSEAEKGDARASGTTARKKRSVRREELARSLSKPDKGREAPPAEAAQDEPAATAEENAVETDTDQSGNDADGDDSAK